MDPLTDLSVQSKGRKVFTLYFNIIHIRLPIGYQDVIFLKKSYCWPCLLFSPEKDVWNTFSFSDLKNFHRAQKRQINV